MLLKRKFGTAAVLEGGLALLMLVGVAGVARAAGADEPGAPPAAQASQDEKGTLEIYGFGQADAIADFKQNNPDWYDVNRPSRLPNVANQFGNDGHFYHERAPEPPRRQGRDADRKRTGEGAVRVRHVRRRRRRRARRPSACAMPGDSTSRSAPARRTASSWTSTSSRTSSTTGGRTACCSSGTCRCSGSRSTTAARTRASRSKRRARAATPACSPTAWNCRT